jgi:hypothetical protein
MKRKTLLEESKEFKELKQEWFKFEPKTEQELFDFIHKLTTEYANDYGTCVHMCVALMKATFEYFNELEGMTGFQVGCMKWEVLQEIFGVRDEIGMKLLSYENIFYPQYDKEFSKITIDKKQFDKIIKMARKELREADTNFVHPNVIMRWQELAAGILPDYVEVKYDEQL